MQIIKFFTLTLLCFSYSDSEKVTQFLYKFQGIIKETSFDSGFVWNDWSKRCDEQSFSECFKSEFNQI
jgi:hypothetical protein